MSMNEYDSGRQYTRYKRHVNDSHERVDANTVNKLQEDINIQQEETNLVKDKAFEERVYTIFNNNLFTNAMFIDYFKTGEYVDMNKSGNGVLIEYAKRQMTLNAYTPHTAAVSTRIYSVHGEEIELNDFFLITNEDIPIGAEIKYYLETSTGERWPILPNALKTPMHLTENLQYGFRVVIEMRANNLGERPKLNGYAILYWDAQVEADYGMTNPDLQRFPEIEVGTDDGLTILVRDRALEDKLVRVIEPLDTVDLTYNQVNGEEDLRLEFVKTNWPDRNGLEMNQINKLYYGDYLNSENEVTTVLQKIRQATSYDTKDLEGVKLVGNDTKSFELLNAELNQLRQQQGRQGGDS